MNIHDIFISTGNVIGDEGGKALCEVLKMNTTVKKLYLSSKSYLSKETFDMFLLFIYDIQGNKIGEEIQKCLKEAWGKRDGELSL